MTPEQIEDAMAPKPLPNPLPGDFPYPLDPEAPFIFNPTPGDNPQAQPWRVPQGNPVPIPNTDPQQYRQPVVRFTSAPTPGEPFRVDARPEDIVGTDPRGLTEPAPVTSGSPAGDKPEQFDLCKEHPDIIACQVFKPDELQPLPVKNKEVPLALNAEGGFPTGGSCPQPKVVQLMGQTFSFSMQPLCDFASGIKPLLIGFAWLSAALVFLGVARREG
ncbi:virulence factor TspB C-terminal domain-related protein [Acidovorax cavernicola]|uniref:virulence factor TspB C-terminal domain-related protein n=1 Tax=Acidovorax cavernicola TaxID=1675792 RepID=UPI00142E0729|nr:virulence factor TspB C-terminal domain-related protein [Acidovorax cavernicola]